MSDSTNYTPSLLASETRPEIDLNGRWSFSLDPQNTGAQRHWPEKEFEDSITVPGSWEEQGYGERPPEFIGGWTKRRSYVGVAWYTREVEIPAGWTERKVWLQLDRVGWESTVFVDGERVASQDSLSAPHRFDLTPYVNAGRSHRISIRVDNALPFINFEGHIHSRHTGTTWGGIIGNARLIATPQTWIEDLTIYPDAATRSVRVVTNLGGTSPNGTGPSGTIDVKVGSHTARVATTDGRAETTLELGPDARLWSDTDPFLHDIEVSLESDGGVEDSVRDRFGLRTFETVGRSLTLNGNKVFLRGYVDCCIFPLTGYPPEDKQVYLDQFAKAKEWGFNHVRLHSWTPGRPFFEAADETGMLVQTELPNWGNMSSDSYLDGGVGDFFTRELDRVISHLQRHPSLVIHCMGNELLQDPGNGAYFRYSPFLNDLVKRGRAADPSRVYADQTGFGHVPDEAERETDVFILHTFRGSTPDTTQTWQSKAAGAKTPVIVHEHTQMDMYARFQEVEKFTGILEPSWLLQARDGLASKGMLDQANRFERASGALQKRCLKELFERVRRTPGLSGVQMLNFTDFPGQGTALNGVLDVFWDEKGHVTAEEFRQSNAETVIYCEAQRRTYAVGGFVEAEIGVSHFGTSDLRNATLTWSLTTDDGTVVAEGEDSLAGLRNAHPTTISVLEEKVPATSTRLTLSASIVGVAQNSWDFWVFEDTRTMTPVNPAASFRVRPTIKWLADYYPQFKVDTYSFLAGSLEREPANQVLLTDRLHVRYVDAVLNGGTLIWLAEDEPIADGVKSRFESLFWSFLWFPEQENQTMGLTIEDHPLLSAFPHDGTSDWQWFHLVDGATAVGLDASPHVQPIVAGVDNWNRGKRLGYLFEARVGRGRILATTLKVLEHYRTQPEAVNLLDAMVRYVQTDAFNPSAELSLAQLWSIPQKPVGYSKA